MNSRRPYHLPLILIFTVLAAIAIVGLIFAQAASRPASGASAAAAPGAEVWTCSMHPQVRLPKPGKCPICSMPLIPTAAPAAEQNAAKPGPDAEPMLTLSEHARAMASVETAPVERRKLSQEIRAVGKVQYNESTLATITSRVDGYIERLYVDYTGVEVKAGDHLVDIYSPDLVVAQQELLLNSDNRLLAEAAKLRLKRWELTDAQIDEVLRTRKPQERITLSSPINGTVTEKLVVKKSAVKAGDVLYRLVNLDSVWVYIDIYEYELSSVRYGQNAEISAEAYPTETFTGRVWFINPAVSDETRTVNVLVNIANIDKRLKPGMFVSATIRAGLLSNGEPAPTGVEGMWTCIMHPQILEEHGGPCPICRMPLTQIPPAPGETMPEDELALAIPVTAVLDSGVRKIAYVERAPGEYAPAELKLGPRAGEYYPVLAGLKEGDRVAVRGAFLLDSQFQITGQPSLFYEHGQAGVSGHQHGAAPPAGGHEGHTARPPVEHRH